MTSSTRSCRSSGTVVGLIGLPCSGKSTLRKYLEELGAVAVDADQIVRKLYEDEQVKREVAALLGTQVVRPDGTVDRTAIAERVFRDPSLLKALTSQIIYPRTGKVLRARIAAFRSNSQPGDVLVLDAPTLLEAGRRDLVDKLIWVEAPEARRTEWAARRGWNREQLKQREAAMLPADQKRALADFVINNAGTLEELREQARRIWQHLHST